MQGGFQQPLAVRDVPDQLTEITQDPEVSSGSRDGRHIFFIVIHRPRDGPLGAEHLRRIPEILKRLAGIDDSRCRLPGFSAPAVFYDRLRLLSPHLELQVCIPQEYRIPSLEQVTHDHLSIDPHRVPAPYILDKVAAVLAGDDRVLARDSRVIENHVHRPVTSHENRALDTLKNVGLFAVLPDLESQHEKIRYEVRLGPGSPRLFDFGPTLSG